MRRWAIINVLLGLVVGLLGLEIVRTWGRELPAVETPSRPPAPERHEKGKHGAGNRGAAQAQQAPTVLVSAISDRDLFDPSRRAMVEDVKAEVPKETGPPPGVTVAGVRIVGRDREVFVTDASQGNTQRRLRVGDQVVGYTVKAIEPTGLTLTSPSGDAVTMPLEVEKGKAPAAAPPRGPAPPRPGMPGVAGAAGASPAAGAQAPPVAAGVRPVPPAVPGAPIQPAPGRPPAGAPQVQNPQLQQVPPEVRQKLEQLKQNDATPRLGRKR